MRKLSAFLLSLLTVVGGHILNRRIDKALLFFSLFLVITLASFTLLPLLWPEATPITTYAADAPTLRLIITTLLPLLTLIISAFVSYADAGSVEEAGPITVPALLGAALSLVISAFVVISVAFYLSIMLPIHNTLSETSGERRDESPSALGEPTTKNGSLHFPPNTHFWHNVRYGYDWIEEGALMPLPKGDAYLVGRMSYGNEPAAGVTLSAIFNDQYSSGSITTDDQGRFTFSLPAGEWRLNRINTKSWSEKPSDRAFTLVGPVNPVLSEASYLPGPEHGFTGLVLSTTSEPQINPALALAIRDSIQLDWPADDAMPADPDNDRLSWQTVPGASHYQVQLQHIERQGSSTVYYPVYWHNSDATTLPLSAIQTASAEADAVNEYQVLVHAFDDDGHLLSSTQSHLPLRSFTLTGRQIPSMQRFPALRSADGSTPSADQIEQMLVEKRLLDAAEILAKHDMPAAARQLIAKRESNQLEKRSDTLEGLILVAEGKCDQARRHFETINRKWHRDCLPDFYEKRCTSL